jgi:hypothetical protein
MEHGDVARLLNVADADVRHYVVNDDGVSVVLTDGVERLWTPDGVFAVNDCPQNRSLRPLPVELRSSTGVLSEDEIASSDDEQEAPDEQAEEEPSAEEVPEGTADEVLSWVDGDPTRAAQAIEAEEQREKPRSVLLGNLRKVSQA